MLQTLLEILGRRLWLASISFVAPLTGVATLAFALPDMYRATATVLVQRDQVPAPAGGISEDAVVETRLQTIREEILSRVRLDGMIERFGLYPELRSRAPREVLIERMRKEIQIQLRGINHGGAPADTIAFTLSFRGGDPGLAAAVANGLAESYTEENLRIRGRRTETLESQLQEARALLDEQEAKIADYQKRHNGELPQQVATNLARMQQLGMLLQMNRDSQVRAQDRRDAIGRQLGEAGHPDASSSPETTVATLARLKRELADLRGLYNEKYPDVIRLKDQITDLERRLRGEPSGSVARKAEPSSAMAAGERLAQRSLGVLDSDLGALKAEEERLHREIEAYRGRVDAAPQREQEFAELSRDYATTKELYASLLKRHQEALLSGEIERDGRGEQLRILDPAVRSAIPFAPNRPRFFLFGLLVSIAFAAGVVALAEQTDTSFHSIDDLRSFTRVPVLVSIPQLKARRNGRRQLRALGLRWIAVMCGLALVAAASWSFGRGNHELVSILARGGPS